MSEDLFKDFNVDSPVYEFLIKQEKEFTRGYLNWIRKNEQKILWNGQAVNSGQIHISYCYWATEKNLKKYVKEVLN